MSYGKQSVKLSFEQIWIIFKYLDNAFTKSSVVNMKIREKIKSLLALNGVTITKLAKLMTEKTGEKYTFQRISHKLRLNRITLSEAYIIADILGYDLEFVDRKNKN